MRHLVAIPTIMNKHGGADDWFGDYLCVYCANLQVDAINLQKQNFPDLLPKCPSLIMNSEP